MKTTMHSLTILALITLAGASSLRADDSLSKTLQTQRQQENFRRQNDQILQKTFQQYQRVYDNNRAITQRSYTPSYRPSYSGRR
jgi:hypothetical protein